MRSQPRLGLAGLILLMVVTACSSATIEPASTSTPTPTEATPSTSSTTNPTSTTMPPPTTTPPTTTIPAATITLSTEPDEYRAGLSATLHLPETAGPVPLVVMIPGGGWTLGDPENLIPLARYLADAGVAALTVEIRAATDEVRYPVPLDDIACALEHGLHQAELAGVDVGPVVLLGHSSGAHLAALVALGDGNHECPVERVDGLIGLAGAYDVTRLPVLAFLLFGVSPEDDPELWEQGNPLLRADLHPELPVLLLHGDADPLLPVSFSQDFQRVLEEAGHAVDLSIISDADHVDVLSPVIVGDLIGRWLESIATS